jgi:hypothetical protein
MRPTVLIVDDHSEFRESASALLEAEVFAVIGEARCGQPPSTQTDPATRCSTRLKPYGRWSGQLVVLADRIGVRMRVQTLRPVGLTQTTRSLRHPTTSPGPQLTQDGGRAPLEPRGGGADRFFGPMHRVVPVGGSMPVGLRNTMILPRSPLHHAFRRETVQVGGAWQCGWPQCVPMEHMRRWAYASDRRHSRRSRGFSCCSPDPSRGRGFQSRR